MQLVIVRPFQFICHMTPLCQLCYFALDDPETHRAVDFLIDLSHDHLPIIFSLAFYPRPQNYPGLHANREHLPNDVSHNSLSKIFFLSLHKMTPKDPLARTLLVETFPFMVRKTPFLKLLVFIDPK